MEGTRAMITRTYSELITLDSFEDRFNYLKLDGEVCKSTFGFDRYLNQKFYNSQMWKRVRDQIIVRDNGCDLGIADHPIPGQIIIHHMNPISLEDLEHMTSFLMNPEFLVCTFLRTHNAIHYGDETQIQRDPIVRTKNDTCPWRHE